MKTLADRFALGELDIEGVNAEKKQMESSEWSCTLMEIMATMEMMEMVVVGVEGVMRFCKSIWTE